MFQIVSQFFNGTFLPFLALVVLSYYKFLVNLFCWLSPNWLSWNKFSEGMLRTLEKKILQIVRTSCRGCYVDIGPVVGPSDKIWTLSFNTESRRTPLVLIHGLGAGAALWCLNIDALAATRPVYAFDLLGFRTPMKPYYSPPSGPSDTLKLCVRSVPHHHFNL